MYNQLLAAAALDADIVHILSQPTRVESVHHLSGECPNTALEHNISPYAYYKQPSVPIQQLCRVSKNNGKRANCMMLLTFRADCGA